jgi:glycosyltransferase involved in cell wall biosynthesis
MKILLLGELSAFHNNLKDGLIELGHDVDLISSGDAWKRIGSSDIKLFSNLRDNKINIIFSIVLQLINIHKLKNYDIVQLISPTIFGGLKYNYNYKLLKVIKNNSKKMFLSSCNTNNFVYDIKDHLRYSYFDSHIKYDLQGENPYIKKTLIENNNRVAQLVDGIIPTSYTYAKAYENFHNVLQTLPLPINTKKVEHEVQIFKHNKVTIFHGISREGFKGSRHIIAAMKRINNFYPDDVEIVIDGKLPLDQYLDRLKDANIVIDQAYSYEYAMNALFAMSMGKVVLSGNEPECKRQLGRDDIPVINILPNEEDIFLKLKELINDRKRIVKLGHLSRKFVEEFHDSKIVAQKYIETWNAVKG